MFGQKWGLSASNTTATLVSSAPPTFGTPVITNSGAANSYENYVIVTIPISGTMPAADETFSVQINSLPQLIQS